MDEEGGAELSRAAPKQALPDFSLAAQR